MENNSLKLANMAIAIFAFVAFCGIASAVEPLAIGPVYISGYGPGFTSEILFAQVSGGVPSYVSCQYSINSGTSWATASIVNIDTGTSYCIYNPGINLKGITNPNVQIKMRVNDSDGEIAVSTSTLVDNAYSGVCTISTIFDPVEADGGDHNGYMYIDDNIVFYNPAGSGIFTVVATATDSRSGVDNVNFPDTVSGGNLIYSVEPFALNYTFDGDSDESGEFVAQCTDFMGWTEDAPFGVVKDDTAPDTEPTGNSGAYDFSSWTPSSVDVDFNCYDDIVGCSYTEYCTDTDNSCDPHAEDNYTSTVTVGTEGYSYIRFASTDYVNNAEAVDSREISIDTTAPVAAFSLPVADGWYADGDEIEVAAGITESTSSGSGVPSGQDCVAKIEGSTDSFSGTVNYNEDDVACEGTITLGEPSGLSDGYNYITLEVPDAVGNDEVSASRAVLVDNTAPETTPTGSGAYPFGTWTDGTVTVSLSCDDATGIGCDETYYCVDTTDACTPTTEYDATPFDVSAEGVSYVRFYSADMLGNRESVDSVAVLIDLTAPETEAFGNGGSYGFGGSWTSSPTVNVTFNCEDDGSGCDYTLYCTDGSNSCVPGTTYTVPVVMDTEGISYIRYASTDNVGNVEDVISQAVAIDTTAPTAGIVAPPTDSWYMDGDEIGVYAGMTEPSPSGGITPGVNCNVEIDGSTGSFSGTVSYNGSSNACEGIITLLSPSELSDGAHQITLSVPDAVGNFETSLPKEILVDSSAPLTGATGDLGDYEFGSWTDFMVSINTSCDDGAGIGCNTTYVCIDTTNNCMPTFGYVGPFNVSAEGVSFARFFSSDLLGNLETVNSVPVLIDLTAPTTTATGTSLAIGDIEPSYEFGTWTPYSVDVYLDCDDEASGCDGSYYCTDTTDTCSPATEYDGPVTVSTEGVSYIRYFSTDDVGNDEGVSSQEIDIDTTAPVASWNFPLVDSYYKDGGTISVYAPITEDGSGVQDRQECYPRIDGSDSSMYSVYLKYNLSEGACEGFIELNGNSIDAFSSEILTSGSGLSDGAHQLTITVSDRMGNYETSSSREIMIDNTAPESSAMGDGGMYAFGSWTDAPVTIALTCDDGTGAGCDGTYYCTDTDNECTPSIEYDGTFGVDTEGISFVRYYSVDELGNTESEQSQEIAIDTTNPEVASIEVSPYLNVNGTLYVPGAIDIVAPVSDGGLMPLISVASSGIDSDTCVYSINGITWSNDIDWDNAPMYYDEDLEACVAENVYVAGGRAEFTILVGVSDNTGNYGQDSLDVSYEPAPEVTIDSPVDMTTYENTTSVALAYTVTGRGAVNCSYSLIEGGMGILEARPRTQIPGCGNITLTGLTNQTYGIIVYANSELFGEGDDSLDFTMLVNNPILEFVNQPDAYTNLYRRVLFNVSYIAFDRNATWFTINGKNYTPTCDATNCWLFQSKLLVGQNTYSVTMTDTQGLQTTINGTTVMDKTKPSFFFTRDSIRSRATLMDNRTVYTIKVAYIEPNLDTASIRVTDLDTLAVQTVPMGCSEGICTADVAFDSLPYPYVAVDNLSHYIYEVTMTDLAGNERTKARQFSTGPAPLPL
jgi:hypothetical protein